MKCRRRANTTHHIIIDLLQLYHIQSLLFVYRKQHFLSHYAKMELLMNVAASTLNLPTPSSLSPCWRCFASVLRERQYQAFKCEKYFHISAKRWDVTLSKRLCWAPRSWKVYVRVSKGQDKGQIDCIICTRFSPALVSGVHFVSRKVKD